MAAAGLLNDLWTLKGLSPEGEASPVWIPLDLPGTPPIPRKGHSLVGVHELDSCASPVLLSCASVQGACALPQ